MVRRIDIHGETVGYWSAIDELMAKQMHEGTFEPTLVVFHWDNDVPCLDLGTYEDADRVNVDLARERGFAVGRRYAFAGGTAVHTPDFPNYMLYYRKKDTNILNEADASGLADVAGLESIGFEAEYDSIGDVEIVKDDAKVKVMAGSAATIHVPDYWVATLSVIWDFPEEGAILDDAVSIPREKFEDKDTDSLTGRMQPLSEVLEEVNIDTTKGEVIDGIARANVDRLIGSDTELVDDDWTDDEQAFLDKLAPFFESDSWINRVSTARMCRRAPDDYALGQAAYKSRKLINVSTIIDDDEKIHDIIIGGDLYVRPQPTITSGGVLKDLAAELRGISVVDEDTVLEAVQQIFNRPETEIPGIEPKDIVEPILRSNKNTMQVSDYLANH